jgi:Cu+-exporting ATPase
MRQVTEHAIADATDPVCRMSVDPRSALVHVHAGETYYFCCDGCRRKFVANPDQYARRADASRRAGPAEGRSAVGRAARREAPAPGPRVIWTCPMHPEIRRDAPGSCPICGMALEPLAPTAEEGENAALVDMTRRFWIAVALTAPLLWTMLGEVLPAIDPMRIFGHSGVSWAQLALATPVVLGCGWPFFVRGWQSIVNRSLNMFTLIALGTGAAWLYSVFATIVPGVLPASFRGAGGAAPLYFEASAVIVTLVLLGQVLELRARTQTSGAIRALLKSTTTAARATSISSTWPSAIGCACGRARTCPSTASWSTERATSTNRC